VPHKFVARALGEEFLSGITAKGRCERDWDDWYKICVDTSAATVVAFMSESLIGSTAAQYS
jgi:hypothetical protein